MEDMSYGSQFWNKSPANGDSQAAGGLDSLSFEWFEQTADGSWRPVSPMVIELEGAGKISIGPWVILKRGRKFLGHDIAGWLDEMAERRMRRAA